MPHDGRVAGPVRGTKRLFGTGYGIHEAQYAFESGSHGLARRRSKDFLVTSRPKNPVDTESNDQGFTEFKTKPPAFKARTNSSPDL